MKNVDDNVKNTLEQNVAADEPFDYFLQKQLQQEKIYLNDDNFTVQVMASLPTVKQTLGWRERFIIVIPLIIISILVLSQNSLLAFVIKSWVLLSVISIESLFKLILEISLVALLGVSYWFAKKSRLL